jgi:hypothetical protein
MRAAATIPVKRVMAAQRFFSARTYRAPRRKQAAVTAR